MRMRKRRKRKRSKRRSSQNKREDSDRKDEWGYAVSPLVPRCSARGCRVQGLSILLCSVPRGSDDHSRIHWETACAVSSVYVGCVNVQLVCSADVTRTEREHINITKLKLYLECDNYPLSFYPSLPLPLPFPSHPLPSSPWESSFITAIFFIVISSQKPQKQPPIGWRVQTFR